MKSCTTQQFRHLFALLPRHVQQQARQSYRLFCQNAAHPGLHFKRVHLATPIYSAGRDWTPIELFLQGAAAIEPHIRRHILVFAQHTLPPHLATQRVGSTAISRRYPVGAWYSGLCGWLVA